MPDIAPLPTSPSRGETYPIPLSAVRVAHTDATRKCMGRGRPHSTESTSAGTAIPVKTLENYQDGSSVAGLTNFINLLDEWGRDYGNPILALAGYELRPLQPGSASSWALAAEVADVSARLAEHMRDGRFDHMELAEQEVLMSGLLKLIQDWRASHPEVRIKPEAA